MNAQNFILGSIFNKKNHSLKRGTTLPSSPLYNKEYVQKILNLYFRYINHIGCRLKHKNVENVNVEKKSFKVLTCMGNYFRCIIKIYNIVCKSDKL